MSTQLTKGTIDSSFFPRDPEDRYVAGENLRAIREKMLDKTLADSYPASDPPSSLPNPSVDSLSAAEHAPIYRAA